MQMRKLFEEMKKRRAFKQSTQLRQKQKLTWYFVAAGVAIAVFVGIGVFIYLNLGTSDETKAATADFTSEDKKGFWTDDTMWVGGFAPPTTGISDDIEIFGYVTHVGNISFGSGSSKTLTITDTLVIEGSLTMGNKSNVTVADGGLLIITDDFTADNKIVVGNGGMIAVGGDMNFPSNSQDSYSQSGGNLYVLGTTSGNSDAESNAQGATELENDFTEIYNYVMGYSETGTLPVEFHYVKAEKNGSTVKLTWATASELNNDFFTVEKSQDSKNFEAIGTVAGAGNSNTLLTYQFTDTKLPTGTQYYRVKQTDFDGQFDYSDIVSVSNASQAEHKNSNVTILTVVPNPFEDRFNVDFDLSVAGPVEVSLIHQNGSVAASEVIEGYAGNNRYTFDDRRGLENGIYLLRLTQHNTTSKAFRLIKR